MMKTAKAKPVNPAATDRTLKELVGAIPHVDKIRWYDPESGVIIAELTDGTIIKGECREGEIEPGIQYRFLGRYIDHHKYGRQFHFNTFILDRQIDRAGIIKYLGVTCSHIGYIRADKLWQAFKHDTIDVLRDEPEKAAATGILNEQQAYEISIELIKDADLAKTRAELFGIFDKRGFPRKLIQAVIEKWGAKAADIINYNPYALLVNNLPGCGFKRCDKLYIDLGHNPHTLKRQMLAGWHAAHVDPSGHTWHNKSIIHRAILEAFSGAANKTASTLALREKIQLEDAIELGLRSGWLAALREGPNNEIKWIAEGKKANDELDLASIVRTMLARPGPYRWPHIDQSAGLSDHQAEKTALCLAGAIGILAGTPGTGKTFTAARIVDAIIKQYGSRSIAVVAPTGKAAVRLTEAMTSYGLYDIQATTIHRLLKIKKSGRDGNGYQFEYNEKISLPITFLIVDEMSMTSTDLAASLFKALGPRTHVLLVGDPYQLPPVGHGAPLRDLIAAGVPYGELTEIRRNAGLIVEACREIKSGKRFRTVDKIDLETGDNLRHIETVDAETTMQVLEKVLSKFRMSGKADPVWDVQVLVSVNEKGNLSRVEVNNFLQGLLNPASVDTDLGTKFRRKDKVMCLKNHMHKTCSLGDGQPSDAIDSYWPFYDENGCDEAFVANGEIGKVLAVNKSHTIIEFPEPTRIVKVFTEKGKKQNEWEKEEAAEGKDDFCLAYAITTHKSQGSDWPIVIILIDDAAGFVTSREHIYTAISRAKKICITIGKMNTAMKQIGKVTLKKRKTFLAELIKGEEIAKQIRVRKPPEPKDFVYLARRLGSDLHKIGFSSDVVRRMSQLKGEFGVPVEVVEAFPSKIAFKLEQAAHKHFAEKRVTGEWFRLEKEDILNFRSICMSLESDLEINTGKGK